MKRGEEEEEERRVPSEMKHRNQLQKEEEGEKLMNHSYAPRFVWRLFYFSFVEKGYEAHESK